MLNTKFKVIRFIIATTGTYNTMYVRPYESNITKHTHNHIVDLACRKELNSFSLNSVSNELIRPSATPESEVVIPNGFSTTRLRFYLEIETTGQMGQVTTEQIIGYTDHHGVINNRAGIQLDPQMVFKINAINECKKSIIKTGFGNISREVLIDSSQIINNSNYRGIQNTNSYLYAMRPEDVYDNISEKGMINGDIPQDSMCYSTRGLIGNTAIKSRRKNNLACNYVSDILNSFIDVRNSSDTYQTDRILEQSKSLVQSNYSRQDKFMAFLKKRNTFSNMSEFNVSDLRAFDENAFNIIEFVESDLNTLHYSGLTEAWGGSDYSTQFATIIAQAVPAYMFENSIRTINMVITNDNIECKAVMLCEGIDLINSHNRNVSESNYNNFEFKIKNELFNSLSMNNTVSFSCRIKANILEDIWIHVSLEGSPVSVYCCPSFCDSLLSPIYTTNVDNLNSIGSDMDSIMNDIPDPMYNHANGYEVQINNPLALPSTSSNLY